MQKKSRVLDVNDLLDLNTVTVNQNVRVSGRMKGDQSTFNSFVNRYRGLASLFKLKCGLPIRPVHDSYPKKEVHSLLYLRHTEHVP